MTQKWTPLSWENKVALHQPNYLDKSKLLKVIKKLKKLPPLVFAGEVRDLKESLSMCVDGKGFLLQVPNLRCGKSKVSFK